MTLEVLVADGYGGLEPLEKGTATKLRVETDPWVFGGYTFKYRQTERGLGVLTVKHPEFAMPFHLVVGSLSKARSEVPSIVAAFEAGSVPEEGVFRREELVLAKASEGRLDICQQRIVIRRRIALAPTAR